MEWKTVKLGEVCDISIGRTPPRKEHEWFNQSTPSYKWVSIKDMGDCGKFIYETSETISEKGQIRYKIPIVAPNTILLSFKLTIGRIAITGDLPMLTNEAIAQLPINDETIVNKDYLFYYLKSFNYNSLGSTSSIANAVNSKMIRDIELPLPPIETQHRIAAILSSLDDKIENNTRINRNLEAQAQALFKSWFVDFEPFGGKMPDDWRFNDISNIPHVLETGRRPKGGAVESGVPSIGAEHIKGMGTYDFSKTKYITEDYARSMKSGKINGYELLIYKDGGKPGYFIPNFTIYGEGYPFEECYINEHVLKLDFPSKAYNIFCYFYFQTPEVMNYLNAQGGKAAIPGINKSDIDNINILTPENEAVVQFGKIVLPYFTKILRNLAENKRLAALRDTLLPKLMKGEIEV